MFHFALVFLFLKAAIHVLELSHPIGCVFFFLETSPHLHLASFRHSKLSLSPLPPSSSPQVRESCTSFCLRVRQFSITPVHFNVLTLSRELVLIAVDPHLIMVPFCYGEDLLIDNEIQSPSIIVGWNTRPTVVFNPNPRFCLISALFYFLLVYMLFCGILL